MELCPIGVDDIPAAMKIIEDARAFQISYGNLQWADGYPSEELLREDAMNGTGFKIVSDGVIAGYLAIVSHDPAYDDIEGRWVTDGPYIALHRIAFSSAFRGRGLFPMLIDECRKLAVKRGAFSIRIDTDRRNPIMRHLLPRLGFIPTGTVLFAGDRKLAYELPLQL